MKENCFFVICPLKGLRTKMSDFCKNIMFSLESCFHLIMKKSINYTVFFYFILLSNGLVIGCNRDMLDCKHSLPRSKVALPSSIVYVWVFEFIHVHLSFCLMIFFVTAVNELFVSIAALQPMVAKMDLLAIQCNYKVKQFGRSSYQDIFWLFLKGTLYSQLPGSHYRQPIKAFYNRAFHVHHGNSY